MTIDFTDIFEQLKSEIVGEVRRNEPMAAHTTWRVGGHAELFILPADSADVGRALQLLAMNSCPWVTFGHGGNLLVRDKGIRGAVIHTQNLDSLAIKNNGQVVAGGGLSLMSLIRQTAQRGLGGIENLVGIPATVGGAIVMNVGAHDQEIGEVVTEITVCTSRGCERLNAATLNFGYRSSSLPHGSLITSATLQLTEADPALLEQNILATLEHRRTSQPDDGYSAGSVFKNPAVKSAWKLIDDAGLRGNRVGGAIVSQKHTNFILNNGKATAEDIEKLIRLVQEAVFEQSGVLLEPEIQVIGERGVR
jgi:UDP-N-acetylmuramate dehydrogenase